VETVPPSTTPARAAEPELVEPEPESVEVEPMPESVPVLDVPSPPPAPSGAVVAAPPLADLGAHAEVPPAPSDAIVATSPFADLGGLAEPPPAEETTATPVVRAVPATGPGNVEAIDSEPPAPARVPDPRLRKIVLGVVAVASAIVLLALIRALTRPSESPATANPPPARPSSESVEVPPRPTAETPAPAAPSKPPEAAPGEAPTSSPGAPSAAPGEATLPVNKRPPPKKAPYRPTGI
jgi:hypothetical protein